MSEILHIQVSKIGHATYKVEDGGMVPGAASIAASILWVPVQSGAHECIIGGGQDRTCIHFHFTIHTAVSMALLQRCNAAATSLQNRERCEQQRQEQEQKPLKEAHGDSGSICL